MAIKRILILTAASDFSTGEVIDWLNKFNLAWVRINEDSIENISYEYSSTTSFVLKLKDKRTIPGDEIAAVWFRRDLGFPQIPVDSAIESEAKHHLQIEWAYARSGFAHLLQQYFKCLGNVVINDFLDKNRALAAAATAGLRTPATLVTTSKDELSDFFDRHKRIITKGIFRTPSFRTDHGTATSFSEEITKEDIISLPERFYYSLFQQYIDKHLDIRVCFLDGRFYSMGVFPITESPSPVDLRKSRLRSVPFLLKDNDCKKLLELMAALKLNFGLIDLCLSKNNEIVFLEVNPIGQYDNLSKRCNYHLDREIAQWLRDATNACRL